MKYRFVKTIVAGQPRFHTDESGDDGNWRYVEHSLSFNEERGRQLFELAKTGDLILTEVLEET